MHSCLCWWWWWNVPYRVQCSQVTAQNRASKIGESFILATLAGSFFLFLLLLIAQIRKVSLYFREMSKVHDYSLKGTRYHWHWIFVMSSLMNTVKLYLTGIKWLLSHPPNWPTTDQIGRKLVAPFFLLCACVSRSVRPKVN